MNYVSYRDKEPIYNVCTEYNMLSGNLPVSDFNCISLVPVLHNLKVVSMELLLK